MLIVRPGQRGYSMIELLVAIAVMSVLIAAVAPSMSEMIANVRLRGAAEAAMTGLQKARSEAIKSNQNVGFWLVSSTSTAALDNSCALSATSSSWVVSYDNPAGLCSSTPSTTDAPRIVQVSNTGPSASNMSIDAKKTGGGAATQAHFNGFGRRADGTASTDISTIDFTSSTSGSRRLRIEVSSVGSVRMCDRDVAVSTDPKYCNP